MRNIRLFRKELAMKYRWFFFALVGIILDFVTKQIAHTQLIPGISVPVLPFLDWNLLYNKGAAFSFLSDQGGWQRWFFTAVSFFASIAIAYWMVKTDRRDRLQLWGLTLLLSGAVGNFIDRLFLGKVIDFIHVSYGWFNWPVFNVADIFVSVGVVIILIASFFEGRQTKHLTQN
ncbi:signal peptidase II [Ignatzschineria sp. RMDPL8A]|uniref:signal peptidase II n=1 Tax=Ignatzschineria sp. RMDPL8A TaxID=2999236 RepID=UPI0024467877|nr:signal peptidase II [Ignatzschineria sp. RMDPL8A]MDG9729518.1 signal peptidase II [Ignatzschineria sp. RMDPL8A]